MSKEKPNYNEIIFTDEQENQIIDMYLNQNMSTVKIGKMFGCTHKPILKVLERHNIPRTGVGQRKYKLDEHYFDVIDTPNKAYILGFLYADGNNSMEKQTIKMALEESDINILETIRNELNSEKPLVYVDNSKYKRNGYTSKNQWYLEFHSKHMCEVLNDIGMIPNKSLKLEFPNIQENLYSHFIRGYFDGDGSIYKHCKLNSATLTITSTESFCKKLKEICEKELGIYCGIYDASNHNGITKVFSIGCKNSCKILLDWLYTDAEMYLQRKYDRYISYFYSVA